MRQRSVIVFEQAITSEASRRNYRYWLDRFVKFYKIKDIDSLLSIDPKKLQIMIEDYLFEIKKTFQPNTVKHPISALRLFLSVNDVTLNWTKIRKFLPKQENKTAGKRAYTTEEVIILLDNAHKITHKALILVMASSGVRDQFVEDLKIKHLKEMSHNCLAMTVHPDTVYEYTTFINPEAKKMLEASYQYRTKQGEKITDDSPVFVTVKGRSMNGINVSNILSRISKRALNRKIVYTNPNTNKNRYDVMSSYGLRKRFDTILKMTPGINIHIVERMMSHKSKTIALDTSYFAPTVEQSFSEYLKAMPQLFINEKFKLKAELETTKNKIKDSKILEDRLRDVEAKLAQYEKLSKQL